MFITKNNLSMQIYCPWIIVKLWDFDILSFFFCSVTFIGFQCSIPNTPCNFERFCVSNSTYSNCHNKVAIFFKSHPCTWWDEPHHPCQWCPTTCWKLNIPTKVAIPLAFIALLFETHPTSISLSLLFDQMPSFHSIFVLHTDCSKYKHS
jgi:hypothetical protein